MLNVLRTPLRTTNVHMALSLNAGFVLWGTTSGLGARPGVPAAQWCRRQQGTIFRHCRSGGALSVPGSVADQARKTSAVLLPRRAGQRRGTPPVPVGRRTFRPIPPPNFRRIPVTALLRRICLGRGDSRAREIRKLSEILEIPHRRQVPRCPTMSASSSRRCCDREGSSRRPPERCTQASARPSARKPSRSPNRRLEPGTSRPAGTREQRAACRLQAVACQSACLVSARGC